MSTIHDVTALFRLDTLALVLSIGVATAACGSHEGATPTASAGTSGGGSGGSSKAGHGGSGGSAGASGAGGSAGSAAPPIMCGTTQCNAPAAALASLAGGLAIPNIPVPIACCVETACGTAPSPTGTCEARAVADARCMAIDPGALSAFSGGPIAGCCTDQGACGVDGALFGRGCIENSDAAAELGMIPLLGPSIKVPPPGPCSPDAGVSEDGGI